MKDVIQVYESDFGTIHIVGPKKSRKKFEKIIKSEISEKALNGLLKKLWEVRLDLKSINLK